MEKINITKLLKDCPKGMELDCTIWDNVVFEEIDGNSIIIFRKSANSKVYLTQYGEFNSIDGKCVIFPKGKTTWEGFVPPYQFKDGDVLTYIYCKKPTIYIYRENGSCNTSYYAGYSFTTECFYKRETGGLSGDRADLRLATEEEKAKLFQAIKDNGYRWNAEAKTLEKLVTIFKVGDKIRHKENGIYCTLGEYSEGISAYRTNIGLALTHKDLGQWELAPKKFDITTLKPFDKVLVRSDNKHRWSIQFFERLNNKLKDSFVCMGGGRYHQCIPFEGNEHLLNTANDCDSFFKVWEES